ncbi:MAG: hypothetical protein KME57_21465 [Scytonema hyalinum WJT4-NPBG1]|nr:hypothetical protein [Scytonema hyalinum WJT4-NPBG1]
MTAISILLQKIIKIKSGWLVPSSLVLRLTLGMMGVFALGIGVVVICTSWTMERMVIENHQQTLSLVATQVTNMMAPKSKSIPWQHELQATLDNWSSLPMWLWVKQTNTEVLVSPNLSSMPASEKAVLMSLQASSIQNRRYKVAGQQLVVKATPLPMVNQPTAMLYVAADITEMLSRSQAATRNLAIALILFFPVLTLTIAVIVRRSLLPLLQINKWITLNDTTQRVPVNLQQLPREVQQLVISCHQLSTSLFATRVRQRQFTNQVSHELRTPLSIVYGYLQSLLRRGTNLTIPQRQALETAATETERIIEILQDLLNQVRADDTVLSIPSKSTNTKLQSKHKKDV